MDHLSCQITIAALGTALTGSVGLSAVLAKKMVQQGAMLTKLASASALLNEKLIERLSLRDPRSRSSISPTSYRNPSSDT